MTEESAYLSRLLQGKWTVQVLCAMSTHPVRLSELKRAIPSASKKALIASLRSLRAQGIVIRRDLSGPVLHVEYDLVDSMRAPLNALLEHLARLVAFQNVVDSDNQTNSSASCLNDRKHGGRGLG